MKKQISMMVEDWRNSGVENGDIILVHSKTSYTVKKFHSLSIKISIEDILESFIKAVGDNGTLLFPLFNFGFANGTHFDVRNTPSHMGVLTEAARKNPKSIRTGHPIYSFAVLGKLKHDFKDVNNYSGYGSDSPFAILRELDGKIGILNLDDQSSMTFYHHVEEMENVNYRYHKKFKGEYIDFYGNKNIREYGLFVRDLAKGATTQVNPMGEILWQKGIYTGSRPGEGSSLRTVRAREVYNETSKIIKSGKAEGVLMEYIT